MGRSVHKVSTIARALFEVYDSSDAAVTGLVTGNFTLLLSKDGTDDATAVTIAETGTGRYMATFTPASTGVWHLVAKHATHAPRGWHETFDVTTYGTNVSAAVWDVQTSAHQVSGSEGLNATAIYSQAFDAKTNTVDIQSRIPTALVSGRMDSSVGAMAAGVVTAAAVATGAIDADALATDAVTEIAAGITVPSANANADALLDRANGVETGVTVRQALQRVGATTAGECTVAGAVVTFKGLDDSTTRVTATVAATGARSEVTYA